MRVEGFEPAMSPRKVPMRLYMFRLVTVSSCCVIGASLEAVVEKAKFLYCAFEATAAAGLGYPLENSALTFS